MKLKNEEKKNQIFKERFYYQCPSFLIKDLYEENQIKNEKTVKYINDSLIDLRNFVISAEITKNENPNKIIIIVENILTLNKQQKDRGCPSDLATHIKLLTPKQMLQRLPIALAQVKSGTHLKT